MTTINLQQKDRPLRVAKKSLKSTTSRGPSRNRDQLFAFLFVFQIRIRHTAIFANHHLKRSIQPCLLNIHSRSDEYSSTLKVSIYTKHDCVRSINSRCSREKLRFIDLHSARTRDYDRAFDRDVYHITCIERCEPTFLPNVRAYTKRPRPLITYYSIFFFAYYVRSL